MNRIYFDLETGPLPESELLPMLPAFDASEVCAPISAGTDAQARAS